MKITEALKAIWVRVVVIAKAAPTVLAGVALIAPVAAQELADALPGWLSGRVTAGLLTVGAVAAALVRVIRRVAQVPEAQRGLLPPGA